MQEIKYKELNKVASAFAAFAYLAISLAVLFWYFGADKLADITNQMGPKSAAFLAAVIFIAPVFLIWMVLNKSKTLQFTNTALNILHKGSVEKTIPYSAIQNAKLNMRNVNSFDLFDAGGNMIFAFSPFRPANATMLAAAALQQYINFKKEIIPGSGLAKKVERAVFTKI